MEFIKKVIDIMHPIEEYSMINSEDKFCEALRIIKLNEGIAQSGGGGRPRKTLFVIDDKGKIIGKLSVYDIIRGLVPKHVKHPSHSRAFYSMVSSRVLEVADNVGEIQEHLAWHKSSFVDIVKQVGNANIKDIMSPVHPLLKEGDTVNHAIYIMFKENIRQPLVVRENEVIGVVNFMAVFEELLEILGPECNIPL